MEHKEYKVFKEYKVSLVFKDLAAPRVPRASKVYRASRVYREYRASKVYRDLVHKEHKVQLVLVCKEQQELKASKAHKVCKVYLDQEPISTQSLQPHQAHSIQ